MPSKVTLIATSGQLVGQEFAFAERSICLIGRSKDCQIKIPSNKDHVAVSRHHCLLDINPPAVRVRDFGSLNGTHVNGELIGRRNRDQSAEEGQHAEFPEQDLLNGDSLRVQNTEFLVRIQMPVFCAGCGEEVPEDDQVETREESDTRTCNECRKNTPRHNEASNARRRDGRTCVKCGGRVTDGASSIQPGDLVCSSCRADPFHLVNDVVCDYEVIETLGKGGMGAVYLARHTPTKELRALKVMLPNSSASPRCRKMFMREVDNVRALQHTNIVQFIDAGYWEGTFFFTMEYCDAGATDALIRRKGEPLPIPSATELILACLDGLDYAHHASLPNVRLRDGKTAPGVGMVHRDISPHNILLTRSGSGWVPKISDFGLAKAFDLAGLSGLTCSGATAGKPFFMCRQQLIDYKFAKPEVDVWAVAATLYCLLTNHTPRDFKRNRDKWKTVLQDLPVPIRKRDQRIPRKLAEVIDQALDDRQELVFQSARQFKAALESAI